MKKFATVLTAAVMLFTSSAFATGKDNVTAKVQAAFLTDFKSAGNVKWEKKEGFYFATFSINNISIDAAYNEDGELLATSRKLEISQLPLSVSLQIGKKYSDYTLVGQVSEINFEGQTHYYFTIENSKQSLNLKCSGDGEVSVESRKKK